MLKSANSLNSIAMIPARLGSQRVPRKNLRFLGGKLLVEWVINSCQQAECFDKIYLNSESEVLRPIADRAGISFYKRQETLASSSATNDEFALDFILNVTPDILVQVNPTSPFTDPKDIKGVIDLLLDGGFDTVHTVKEARIEAIYNCQPLNFEPKSKMLPSQQLMPVQLFASSIMAWRASKFIENMRSYGSAVYGGDGRIGYYPISGAGEIDIDNEKDFLLAESMLISMSLKKEVTYYEG